LGLEGLERGFWPLFSLILSECVLLGIVALALLQRARWAPAVIPWQMLVQYALAWVYLRDSDGIFVGAVASLVWLVFFEWYRRRPHVVAAFDRHSAPSPRVSI
jgi:hypothetical protein